MSPDIHREVLARLKADYGLKARGTYLREGRCPACDKKELWTGADKPWVLRCGREDKCGETFHVKQLYPDIFDDWSKRHRQSPDNPHAAADAYLVHARGFDLQGLRGAYAQEWYRDAELNLSTATVRFPWPGGGYWERLIDQPGRFGKKKARFSYQLAYKGQWWAMPGVTSAKLAEASEIWIVEGIFDAIAMSQGGKVTAVSTLTCNNYPAQALAQLRRAAAEADRPPPKLIWAFDVGAAGTRYTREFVKRARKDGWACGAAQVRPDGEGDKLDWNDLHQRDLLGPDQLEQYLWNGEVTIAGTASEKAMLIHRRERYASFPLTFAGKQLWANFSVERMNAIVEAWLQSDDPELADLKSLDPKALLDRAAEEAVSIEEVANCTFRTLYFQRDPNIDEGAYFIRVDFPSDRASVKATFSGSACAGSGDFKKRLASVAPGAQWTGSQHQIDRLMSRQWEKIRLVEAIQHTGYSREHEAWVFGSLAVHKGRVHEPNEEDYFTLGKQAVKLRTADRLHHSGW